VGLQVPQGTPEANHLLSLLCAPGFSTRDESDRASGRGVGMAVVQSAVEELSGSLSLETTPWRRHAVHPRTAGHARHHRRADRDRRE
jgi:two-component system chemotaxis sensor kinase CheA